MSAKNVTETMNNFVVDFFQHIESICEERGLDEETISVVKQEWYEWKNEKKFDNLVKKEVKKAEKKEVKKAEKKAEKKKKPKDAPKNARSAYILFSQDMRPDVKKEQPELDAKDVLKALGALWKNADEDVKAKYQKLADEDKVRFKEEMDNYVPSEDEKEKDKKTKKGKKPKDAPKSARSAYIFFSQDMRPVVKEENPEMKSTEIMTELGKRWKEFKDSDDAKKYIDMAQEDKERYNEEMKAYKEKNGGEESEESEENEEDKPKKATKETKKEAKPKETKPKETKKEKKVKVKTNLEIVKEIYDEMVDNGEKLTFKTLRTVLTERGYDIDKDELKSIIEEINQDEE